jgi:hypothetical protein
VEQELEMMTNEERQKLIAELREDAPDWTTSGYRVRLLCDELEQLAAENNWFRTALRAAQTASAQPDAAPVRPGPNAGHSIDPIKSGPDDLALRYSDKVEKSPDGTETRHLEIAQSDAEPVEEEKEALGAVRRYLEAHFRTETGQAIPQNVQRYMRDDIEGDTRTDEQKQPGPNHVPIGGAGNGA